MSFDWKKCVSNGLTAGIKGVVAGTVAYGLAWALDSLFGLELGKPGRTDQKNQMIDELKKIESDMTEMNSELVQITADIASLQTQMSVDFAKTIAVIEGQKISAAIASIDSNWQALQWDVQETLKNSSCTAGTANKLSSQILMTNTGIQTQINTIKAALLPSISDPGLLDAWTNVCILNIIDQARTHTGSTPASTLRTAYLWLENTFYQNLQYLHRGYSLMLAALIQKNWNSDLSIDENNAIAQQIGQDYLAHASKDLAELSHMFMQCVYRLIFCQYYVPNTVQGVTQFLPFNEQWNAHADFILTRANLAYWLINSTSSDPADPGIIFTSFLRPSQFQSGQAPLQCPSSLYEPSRGENFQLTTLYVNNWYRVIDYKSSSPTMLLDYAESTVQIVNYDFPTPTPVVGQAVGTDPSTIARIRPAYYNKSTLNQEGKASDSTVIFGYGTDFSAVAGNALFNHPSTRGDSSSTLDDTHHGENRHLFSYSTHSSNQSGVAKIDATLRVYGSYDDGPRLFHSVLEYPVTYSGTSSAHLNILMTAQSDLSIYCYCPAHGYAIVPTSATTSILRLGQTAPNTTNSVKAPSHDDPPTVETRTVNYFESIAVSNGSNITPSFDLASKSEDRDWYKAYDDYNTNYSQSTISWSISDVTIAWPQPVVS